MPKTWKTVKKCASYEEADSERTALQKKHGKHYAVKVRYRTKGHFDVRVVARVVKAKDIDPNDLRAEAYTEEAK